jgi:hypothetical protein
VALGHGVQIAEGACLISEGGLTIGDHTWIGRDAAISTVEVADDPFLAAKWRNMPRPVIIGRHVHIEARACVLPGVAIGDGACIRAGAVVGEDVPSGAVVAPAPARVQAGQSVAVPERSAAEAGAAASGSLHWDNPAARTFFVVSTGRSGSLTLARVLSQHPQVRCVHEPRPQMIRLSAEYDYGLKTRELVERELRGIYGVSVMPAGFHCGESDQKYWSLIPLLATVLPHSRFIWVVRDGRDVVASKFAGTWFRPVEAERGDPVGQDLNHRWMYYREDGAKSGALPAAQWEGMSVFAKNCWGWQHVNAKIEEHLNRLPAERWMRVRLEELSGKTDELFRFLGVEPAAVRVERHNAAERSRAHRWAAWDAGERTDFERACADGMNRWYAGWRSDAGEWQPWPFVGQA